jgi:hypothetical protein
MLAAQAWTEWSLSDHDEPGTGVVYAIKDPRFCRYHANKRSLQANAPQGRVFRWKVNNVWSGGILSAAEDPKGSAGT